MRRWFCVLVLALGLVTPAIAQTPAAFSFEQLTIAASVVGFATTTHTNAGAGAAFNPTRCVGISEDATFRFRVDGINPTASVGNYVPTGSTIEITGRDNITRFKAIRTGSTSAVVGFTCYL
jgi:hypothetical protein